MPENNNEVPISFMLTVILKIYYYSERNLNFNLPNEVRCLQLPG